MEGEWIPAFIRVCPNKFKILRWTVDLKRATIWTFRDKTCFFANFFQHREPDIPVGKRCNEMHIFDYKPSVKERAWFMAFFNAGAFFLESGFGDETYP